MMSILFSDIYSLAAYFFLTLAIFSLWMRRISWLWLFFLILASGMAFFAKRMGPVSILTELGLGILSFLFYRKKLPRLIHFCLFLIIFGTSVALEMHLMPGFRNWLVLPDTQVSGNAYPIRMYLNLDKTLPGIFILGWGFKKGPSLKEWRRIFQLFFPWVVVTSSVLLGCSYLVGYVKFDLKWYGFSAFWLFVNLVFTCVAEEALFRGFLQKQLGLVFKSSTFGFILSSVLFGLAHYKGGWTYVGLATIAGGFYGFAYQKAGRLEASILVHFFVNAIHFLAFTYPALR